MVWGGMVACVVVEGELLLLPMVLAVEPVVTAIDLFYLTFLQAQQCSQGGRVPGVG